MTWFCVTLVLFGILSVQQPDSSTPQDLPADRVVDVLCRFPGRRVILNRPASLAQSPAGMRCIFADLGRNRSVIIKKPINDALRLGCMVQVPVIQAMKSAYLAQLRRQQ